MKHTGTIGKLLFGICVFTRIVHNSTLSNVMSPEQGTIPFKSDTLPDGLPSTWIGKKLITFVYGT